MQLHFYKSETKDFENLSFNLYLLLYTLLNDIRNFYSYYIRINNMNHIWFIENITYRQNSIYYIYYNFIMINKLNYIIFAYRIFINLIN